MAAVETGAQSGDWDVDSIFGFEQACASKGYVAHEAANPQEGSVVSFSVNCLPQAAGLDVWTCFDRHATHFMSVPHKSGTGLHSHRFTLIKTPHFAGFFVCKIILALSI